MPDTRGRPLPSEILSVLKDPSIQNYLRSFLIATASAESIGRYPGNGSAQDDQYVYPDAADANFAYNFDYVVPSNFQRLVSAKLSFKIRAYRTYSSLSLATTGATTLATDSTGESGHSHNHAHNLNIGSTGFAATVNVASPNGPLQVSGGPITDTQTVGANAQGSSGHSHSHNHGSHTHTVSGSTTLGIAEDVAPSNPGITVSVDGTDVTTKLGGPFNTDQVEIDVTQVLKTSIKLWHVVALQPNQRVRITGILRLSYYVDSRVPQ